MARRGDPGSNRYVAPDLVDIYDCMLKLVLNAGLRVSEVLGLTWADLDLQTGKLVVGRGKGDEDRSSGSTTMS